MMLLIAKSESCRHPNKLARMHSKVSSMDLHGTLMRFQFKSGSFYVSGPVRQAVVDKLNKQGFCDFEFKAADPDCTCRTLTAATLIHTSTSVTLNKLRSTRKNPLNRVVEILHTEESVWSPSNGLLELPSSPNSLRGCQVGFCCSSCRVVSRRPSISPQSG